ncbi:glycosyltransferase [Aequorivita sediminis]|uniref:glycosyltransferase n=1 Tax=Aequorivita sediminis TaxID=3073653 RepID=UPI0028B0F83F|nr:glycosyltransferase [Aequorivita sp. F6058]
MKLAIISHTEHYKHSDGTIVGWGPTISEINHLAQDFDEIYHLAFLHPEMPPHSSLPYTSSKIKFIPMKPVGGKGIGEKLKIIANVPSVINSVNKVLHQVDVFQLRTPTGIGVFLIPYLSLFSKKKGWYKYAGNWNQKNPPFSYALQRWMLKKQHRKVTINGRWPEQKSHCITFENPCLTEEERLVGLQIINAKVYKPPYTMCFVGRLEDAKGVQRIIDAFGSLKNKENVNTIHFIGNGDKMNVYRKQCEALQLPVKFHGFLDRAQVFEIYKKSHFLMLPSTASEGFPKVIAEAMNFGCLPIVSSVSSITQYVNASNGFVVDPCTAEVLRELILDILEIEENELKVKASKAYKVAKDFTFENYRHRIKTEILKESTS